LTIGLTGVVDIKNIITGSGARPGDYLVLTKPLGTEIIVTALKGEIVSEQEAADTLNAMAMLNASASKAMVQVEVSACTDITGFGLLGHLQEMLMLRKTQ